MYHSSRRECVGSMVEVEEQKGDMHAGEVRGVLDGMAVVASKAEVKGEWGSKSERARAAAHGVCAHVLGAQWSGECGVWD